MTRENMFDGSGNHNGYKDTHEDGTVHIFEKDGTHKGSANDSGTFKSDGTLESFGNHPGILG